MWRVAPLLAAAACAADTVEWESLPAKGCPAVNVTFGGQVYPSGEYVVELRSQAQAPSDSSSFFVAVYTSHHGHRWSTIAGFDVHTTRGAIRPVSAPFRLLISSRVRVGLWTRAGQCIRVFSHTVRRASAGAEVQSSSAAGPLYLLILLLVVAGFCFVAAVTVGVMYQMKMFVLGPVRNEASDVEEDAEVEAPMYDVGFLSAVELVTVDERRRRLSVTEAARILRGLSAPVSLGGAPCPVCLGDDDATTDACSVRSGRKSEASMPLESRLVRLPCLHVLHRRCARKWFETQLVKKQKPQCPYCRQLLEDAARAEAAPEPSDRAPSAVPPRPASARAAPTPLPCRGAPFADTPPMPAGSVPGSPTATSPVANRTCSGVTTPVTASPTASLSIRIVAPSDTVSSACGELMEIQSPGMLSPGSSARRSPQADLLTVRVS